jgi:transcription termination factor Rho
MALPPKTDDDESSARGDSAAGEPKKTRRPSSRPRRAKSDKAPKSAKTPADAPSDTSPSAEAREQPPRAARAEPAAPPPVERASETRTPASTAPEPARFEAPPPPKAEAARADTPSEPPPPQSTPSQETPPPAPAPQGGGQSGQGGQGGRGDWQQGQQDRGYWKHGKRKRGRHGGNWQPGGPGGREQHPAQMPPPSTPQVFGDLPNPSRFTDLAALDGLAAQLSSGNEPLWLHEIYAKSLADLTAYARGLGVKFDGVPNKRQLLTEIFKFAVEQKRPLRDRGYIDQNDKGSFVVHTHVNYRLYPEDAYLPDSLVKRYGLKRGHKVEVTVQAPQEGDRCPAVVRVDQVMGLNPDDISKVTPFEELVPYYPLQRILLENAEVHPKDVSMRAVDILTPIGFGQRGLIVAPPRTGKTILLQNIANSISANSPDVKLILLLIDERPEEVTDFRRHTKGEVVSSTFDETPENHVHCAEMVIEICRRRVEQGEHVVILLDSITRLARAYNALTTGGKTMSGGLESNALQKPKRFFGSARNIEGGGSLTIVASALIDTGSRMDEIIFEEFKGTGNSELHLDRGLVERRIFPAINIDRSGTRKEELIYHPDELQRIYGLRRAMQGLGPIESMEMLITRLKKTQSNAEFLLSLAPK